MIIPVPQWGSPSCTPGLHYGPAGQWQTGVGLGGVRWQSPTPGHPRLPPWTARSSGSLQDERFKAHDLLEHRRLLWHGTNVAVIAAILKSGLRIMPHSGGRVGKGIYFASENSKSACYGEGPGMGGTAQDARRVGTSPAAFAYPLPGSCGHAKPLPCHGSWSLHARVA